jgi:PKD domain-containing protein
MNHDEIAFKDLRGAVHAGLVAVAALGACKADEPAEVVHENMPPVANAGGPYTGIITGPAVAITGSGYDPDGAITAYAWDLDYDRLFDDGATANAQFTCTTPPGPYSVRLQVTDNGTPPRTAIDTALWNV